MPASYRPAAEALRDILEETRRTLDERPRAAGRGGVRQPAAGSRRVRRRAAAALRRLQPGAGRQLLRGRRPRLLRGLPPAAGRGLRAAPGARRLPARGGRRPGRRGGGGGDLLRRLGAHRVSLRLDLDPGGLPGRQGGALGLRRPRRLVVPGSGRRPHLPGDRRHLRAGGLRRLPARRRPERAADRRDGAIPGRRRHPRSDRHRRRALRGVAAEPPAPVAGLRSARAHPGGLAAMTCACGTEVAPALLACPSCHALVHAAVLKGLASSAEAAGRRGDRVEELANWRRALELLPPGSRQAAQVGARVAALSEAAAMGRPPAAGTDAGAAAGGEIGEGARRRSCSLRGGLATGLAFLATKAKLLLLGLTKAGTLLSMLLTVGVYWTIFGWWFAVLVVLSIYVHEMGHVAALRRFGIQASAPMFVPGLGALIRLRQHPANPREDARIGLAGPIWGLGAAAFAYAGFLLGWGPLWAAVARFGAWVNLFNLLPVWQLDGGRAFRALSRRQRLVAAAVLAGLWALSREGLLLLLLLAAAVQAFRRDAPETDDPIALGQYAGLAAVLTLLCQLHVPLGGPR